MKTEIYSNGHVVVSHVLPGRTYRVVGFSERRRVERKDIRFCAHSQAQLAKRFLLGVS